ncbi:MAG TPA: CehA/McbA family metallohydrolase [Thermoanaerobaculia bacterium]|nr:CehA/McbA family metallohydrolase [Thermoanaerobaculia bacterium]
MLREDLGAARHESDGGGRAWLESQEPAVVRAGGRGRWTVVYETGPLGIAHGGMILFQVSPFWGWSTPQVDDPALPGYTTVTLEAAAATGAEAPATTLRATTLDRQLLGIRVEQGELHEGDRVRIVYGAGEALAAADRFAERATRLWIGVDGDGDGRRVLLHDSPTVDIAPGPPARLAAHLPSAAEPGATVPLTLAVLDASGSGGVEFEGSLRLSTEAEGTELPREVRFLPEHRGVRRVELRVAGVDVVRVRVEGPGGLEASTNPLVVTPGGQRILWADLHGHSHFSDGTGTPEDYFAYARDVAALDVVALTDHDHWGMVPLAKTPAMWDEIRAQVERFHDRGRFVTLLGYEWTNWVSGHRHVLYFGNDLADADILSSLDPRYETPPLLWDALRGRDALTFAHHSAGGPIATDWTIAPDPELEPVTEVVSVHGSSEALDSPLPIYAPVAGNFVRDVLDSGYRLGLIGSGDSHDGHPGLAHLASPSGGIAAILADELTREAVLEALRERRVYATNGPRIVLRVALDGARMGSSVPAGKEHRLQVVIAAAAPLERVDVVRSGGRMESQRAAGRMIWTLERELGPTEPGEYLYVRAVQEDGGAAWSSPFFFE